MIDSHEMPYKGVMIIGKAVLEFDNVIEKRIDVFSKYVSPEKTKAMVENYASELLPVYVRVIPRKISSWDYAK